MPTCTPACLYGTCQRTSSFNATSMVFKHSCQCEEGWSGDNCGTGVFRLLLIHLLIMFVQPFASPAAWVEPAVFQTRATALRTGRASSAMHAAANGPASNATLVCHDSISHLLLTLCSCVRGRLPERGLLSPW